ncbi:OmpP1/FadL family transporter [Lacinutrix sp. MedPE-SW]|uniref:OmpP1/FadL family transporter n=1 Tax=Lacinutrix sp. MedPE-SW TaxID=1860087 RepID=UPI0025BB67E6|nr:outer membrane protein transport protein [Lacinutrix sp. MedPE-SW]
MSTLYSQSTNDALRYSNGEIIGSARFKALSGAFGALGGDLSAVNINPASSAVFTNSYASFSINNMDSNNETNYFGGRNSISDSDFSLNQAGGVFVFRNTNENSKWKKFSFSIAYDNTKNYHDTWTAAGTNNKDVNAGGSIAKFFLNNANGLRLDEISAFAGESYSEAYSEIGSFYGEQNQQAFLGYTSYIIESETGDDADTNYFSNVVGNSFDQQYNYTSTGYNGKLAFNIGAQYGDNIYLGLNLNSHFLNFERFTSINESNDTSGAVVNDIYFENILNTNGSGFSFQLGSIIKVTDNLRLGLAYDSPTWMTIEEETTQFIQTNSRDGIPLEDGSTFFSETINPQVVNIFAPYKLQTPAKITGSLAYVFGTNGLLSFDYSRKDYSNTKFKPTSDAYYSQLNSEINNIFTTANTYKFGGEYKIKQLSLRAGYRFEESPYKDENTIGDLTGYSLGLGYRFGNTSLDLTFDQAEQSRNQQIFNTGLVDRVNIDNTNSNITLSLGFQL